VRSLRRQPDAHQDRRNDRAATRGRHIRRSRRKWFLAVVPVVAIAGLLATNVANGSTQRPIKYRVAAPITLQALGVDLNQAEVGQTVTAGAKLVAERPTTLRELAIAVRDQAGEMYDFPHMKAVAIGPAQKEFTAQRSFSKAGTYTFSVAYIGSDGVWKNLGVRDTFTVLSASGGDEPVPTPTTSSPTPTPSATTSVPKPPPSGDFPNATNTGVPAGVALTAYTGSCSITANGTVIDAKIVNCDLSIKATDVVIKRSRINGEINGGEGTKSSFRVEDSEVINPARQACQCIGSDNFTVVRTEIRGGNRGIYCRLNCTVEDSWIHGTALLATQHASAVRVEQHSTIHHNTLQCDWTAITDSEIGCSADMTGYPDFAPITHNTITNNLFVANPAGTGFCAYGGATAGKPFSNDPTNATFIKFSDNVWQRGSNGKCGTYGPITGFDSSRTGNEWTNNRFDDGTVIQPSK
jgi:hypothetical protein